MFVRLNHRRLKRRVWLGLLLLSLKLQCDVLERREYIVELVIYSNQFLLQLVEGGTLPELYDFEQASRACSLVPVTHTCQLPSSFHFAHGVTKRDHVGDGGFGIDESVLEKLLESAFLPFLGVEGVLLLEIDARTDDLNVLEQQSVQSRHEHAARELHPALLGVGDDRHLAVLNRPFHQFHRFVFDRLYLRPVSFLQSHVLALIRWVQHTRRE